MRQAIAAGALLIAFDAHSNGRTFPNTPEQQRVQTQCFARGAPAEAVAVLRSQPGTRDEGARFSRMIAKSKCLTLDDLQSAGISAGSLTWGFIALERRGDLAQVLLADKFSSLPNDLPRRTWPDGQLVNGRLYARLPAARRDRSIIIDLAQCLANVAWQPTTRVLVAPRGSGAEQTALTELQPFLRRCLPNDFELAMQKSVLRGALAEAAYHALAPAR